jgi:MYXO-CTERM domain-containing protein
MKYAHVLTYVRASVLAGSLLLLPMTTPFAQVRDTTTAMPEVRQVETRVERDYTGLWGLLGLLGLAGLAGRRRPDAVPTSTAARERSRV